MDSLSDTRSRAVRGCALYAQRRQPFQQDSKRPSPCRTTLNRFHSNEQLWP